MLVLVPLQAEGGPHLAVGQVADGAGYQPPSLGSIALCYQTPAQAHTAVLTL